MAKNLKLLFHLIALEFASFHLDLSLYGILDSYVLRKAMNRRV
jgi:hypothetical protein